MLVHHLSQPFALRPRDGHRGYIAPLVRHRRAPVAPREPELPLEKRQ